MLHRINCVGDDHLRQANRAQFLAVANSDRRAGSHRIVDGKIFLASSEIQGGMVISTGQRHQGAMRANYEPKTFRQFREAIAMPCSRHFL